MTLSEWQAAAEAQLLRDYAINFADVGFEDAVIVQAWEGKEEPIEFIERLAKKFDLEPLANGYFQRLP